MHRRKKNIWKELVYKIIRKRRNKLSTWLENQSYAKIWACVYVSAWRWNETQITQKTLNCEFRIPLNKWKLQELKLTNIIDGNLENGNQKQNKRRIWKMIY